MGVSVRLKSVEYETLPDALTVTLALPLLPALVAVIVKVPGLLPAVKRPLELMDPPPEVAQVKPGWVDSAAPN